MFPGSKSFCLCRDIITETVFERLKLIRSFIVCVMFGKFVLCIMTTIIETFDKSLWAIFENYKKKTGIIAGFLTVFDVDIWEVCSEKEI